jgi:DNA polymerase III subunit beta
MKLLVTQENLNKALHHTAKVAMGRNSLPILNNILISAEINQLKLVATNLEIAITHYIGAKISTPGSITLPARLMQEFIGNLPSGPIDLSLSGQKMTITSGKYSSSINGIGAEEYPELPKIASDNELGIDAKELKKALSQVVFSASSDDSRPVLTAVLMNIADHKITLASTDSYRLSEKIIKTDSNLSAKLLIPASAVADLLRIIGDSEETVTIKYDDNQVCFAVGESELITRQVDGEYPNYQALVPKEFKVVASVDKDELLRITKVTSLFARESAGSITLTVDELTKELKINSLASQVGENSASTAATIKGEGGFVTINSRYLIEALSAFSSKNIDFCFNDKLAPCVISSAKEPGYIHIIMPLKS